MADTIIGLMGKKGSGKDTFANLLVERHGFTRLAFADWLKDMALDVDPLIQGRPDLPAALRLSELVRFIGWDRAKNEHEEVRQLLQKLGVAVRERVSWDAWITPVRRQVAETPGPVVITDARFLNEIRWIEQSRGALVRVVNLGLVSTDTHESETALDDVPAGLTVAAQRGDLDKLAYEAEFLARAVGVRVSM